MIGCLRRLIGRFAFLADGLISEGLGGCEVRRTFSDAVGGGRSAGEGHEALVISGSEFSGLLPENLIFVATAGASSTQVILVEPRALVAFGSILVKLCSEHTVRPLQHGLRPVHATRAPHLREMTFARAVKIWPELGIPLGLRIRPELIVSLVL